MAGVDRTNAERQRRYKARRKALAAGNAVTPGLSAAALLAEHEAHELLGSDAEKFATAVRRYVLAVDRAEHARVQWDSEERPMRDKFANGTAGVHPLLKAVEQLEAQASRFAAELGLTPASAKRIAPGVRGRPPGAVSAPDRSAPPPVLKLTKAG